MSDSQIRFPSVTVSVANADVAAQNTAQRVLAVGQMGAGGSATSGVLIENIASTGAPEDALFDADSQIAAIVRAFKVYAPEIRLDVIPLDDAVGTPRVVGYTLAGTATAAGTVTVVAGSETNHKYEVAVASGDTAETVCDAITVAVNADTKVPFTHANTVGACTLTAINDGTVANDLGVEVITDAAGITLSVQVAEATPGATDPTLTGVLDVATERYQGIIWPYSDTTVPEAYLAARLNPTNAVLDGVSFTTKVDTHANHLTDADENDQSIVIFADKLESEVTGTVKGYIGPAQNEATYVKSAYFAAIRAKRLTLNASISSLVTTSASLDQFGGPALATLPYANTPIDQLPAIAAGRGWTETEIRQLVAAGRAVMGMNIGGDTALVGEVVTTYVTDSASNPDPTFTFLNYVDTASQIREYRFNNLRAQYAQSRLTEGSVTRGRSMANKTTIKAFVEKLYLDLAGPNYVLVQDGEAAIQFYKDNLFVVPTLSSGLVTITDLTPIVTQLRTIVMPMKITFSVGS
jgi:phage tail sheath gpL-like